MRSPLLLCIIVCTLQSVSAQIIIPTPLQPAAIIIDDNVAHVLCGRTDRNYNGEIDTGDVPASWLMVDVSTHSVLRSQQFAWNDVHVNRCGVDVQKDILDISLGDEVWRFNTATQTALEKLYTGAVFAVATSPDLQTLWMSVRPSFTDPGYVIEYNIKTKEEVRIPVDVNPQQVIPHTLASGAKKLLVVSEGDFGASNGTVRIVDLESLPRTQTAISVGDTPNHVTVSNDTAYVTVNGSHSVVVIDLVARKAVDTILVGTTGYDGPRESVILTDKNGNAAKLLVSTFASDVRAFDLPSGTPAGSIKLAAKPEGMARVGNDLWVTRSYTSGGYDPASDVAVYDLTTAVSVLDDATPTPPRAVYSASSTQRVPFQPGTMVRMADISGRTTEHSAVVSASQTIDCSDLPTGVYVVTDGTTSLKLMRHQ